MPFLEYRDMFRAFGTHFIPICWKGINTALNKYLGHYLYNNNQGELVSCGEAEGF